MPLWISLFLYYFSGDLLSSSDPAQANGNPSFFISDPCGLLSVYAASSPRQHMPRSTLKWLVFAQIFLPIDIIHKSVSLVISVVCCVVCPVLVVSHLVSSRGIVIYFDMYDGPPENNGFPVAWFCILLMNITWISWQMKERMHTNTRAAFKSGGLLFALSLWSLASLLIYQDLILPSFVAAAAGYQQTIFTIGQTSYVLVVSRNLTCFVVVVVLCSD